jgi:hypothetical protein
MKPEVVHTIDSSFIRKVAYQHRLVEITLKNGRTYMYSVPRKRAFNNLVKARSVGRYFNKVFKKNYGPGDLLD